MARYHAIGAVSGVNTGYLPSAIIDETNGKLLVAAMNPSGGGKLGLFRCDLDGSCRTHLDISAGQATNSGQSPAITIDPVHQKVLVVTTNASVNGGNKPSLFRCNLDGTSCTHTDISTGLSSSGFHPSVVVDTVNNKLLAVTMNSSTGTRPTLFRCNLDGTSCTHTDITAAQPALSGYKPSAAIDRRNGALVVATSDGAREYRPSLFRCALDGTACTFADLSDGQGVASGSEPNLLVDGTTGAYLVVTANGADEARPALFSICGR